MRWTRFVTTGEGAVWRVLPTIKINYMDYQVAKDQAVSFLKGLLAVVLVNAGLAALQYVGAHIPELITWLTQLAAASSTIHLTKK